MKPPVVRPKLAPSLLVMRLSASRAACSQRRARVTASPAVTDPQAGSWSLRSSQVLASSEGSGTAALGSGGAYFGPLWGRDDVGVLLDGETDWDEIAELVTESYRLRAPVRLAATLDAPKAVGPRDR